MNQIIDVIYGRKCGMALTLDIFQPENPNGRGVVLNVAGGWKSGAATIAAWREDKIMPLVERGYTVFVVVTCSGPRFAIPDLVDDLHRAVRFVRHHAHRYGVDPGKLGLSGFSAGGHLALTVGFDPRPAELQSDDPVERQSSRVAAIAEFYGPTDFFNYGGPGQHAFEGGLLKDLAAAYDFQEWDDDEAVFHSLGDKTGELKKYSPVELITQEAPPTLLVHGDQDYRVPLQQSQLAHDRLRDLGVPVKLAIIPGRGHSWPEMRPEVFLLADWYDEWLT